MDLNFTSAACRFITKGPAEVIDFYRRAVAAEEVFRMPDLADQSHGERMAQVLNPFGYRWTISWTIERVDPSETQRCWNKETSA